MYLAANLTTHNAMYRIGLFIFLLGLITSTGLRAQVAKDQVLMVHAEVQKDGLKFVWTGQEDRGPVDIYKVSGVADGDWGEAIATVPAGTDSYTDTDFEEGAAYEYRFAQKSGTNIIAFGYLYSGLKHEPSFNPGGIILLIDSTFISPLADQFRRLENDLIAEGWEVSVMYAGRGEATADVKLRLIDVAGQMNEKAKAVLILGHVPVPYSGNFSKFTIYPPDGHAEGAGNHVGAWAADVYYGDLDGKWTDNTANNTDGRMEFNHNVPGDGKFDQIKIPGTVELAVGRVDFFDMPAFQKSDTSLLSDYLDRNHKWRTAQWKVTERALIDNNFGSFNIASTGYHNFSTMIEPDSIFDNRDYRTSLSEGSYLWAFGCGAGSFRSCNGIGRTSDFARSDTLENVFTSLAGSYFGDWDNQNAFLRAPLGNQALVSFWGGIPKWYLHHMALGMSLAHGVTLSQTNTGFYFTGLFNASDNSIHIALMGDPSLRMRNLAPLSGLTVESANGNVELSWNAVNDEVDGYFILRRGSDSADFVKVNGLPIQDTVFTDENNWYSGDYEYMVRPVRLETTPSGSYYNYGPGMRSNVEHINSMAGKSPIKLNVYPNPADQQLNIVIDREGNSTGLISLTDLSGRTILSRQLRAVNNVQLQTADLLSGIYLMEYRDAAGNEVRTKIIIRH